jgi:ABC-2 type transport system permease protein
VWLIGIFVIAASYGSILGDSFDNFIASSDFYSQMVGTNPDFPMAQMFVSMITVIMSFFSLAPVLMAILKLRSEEKEGRTEHVFTRVVSRMKYMASYTIIAFVTGVLAQGAIAVGVYASASSVMSDPGALTLGYLLKATMVYVPAIWVIIGITVLLVGLLPKATGAIWGYFGFTFFAVFVGRMPGLFPDWFSKLTPYGHVPQLPVDTINYGTLAVLVVIAAALTAAGFVFYRKRDTVTV